MTACPTPCADDCAEPCHEAHQPSWLREHPPAFHDAPDVGPETDLAPPHRPCLERVLAAESDDKDHYRRCGRIITYGDTRCGVH